MGIEDDFKDIEGAVDGQSAANEEAANPSGNDAKFDTIADSVIDGFAAKEGVPAAADAEINNIVNDEINKF